MSALEPPFLAYCCISPHGAVIRGTLSVTADDSWRKLRAAVSEPDTLIDKGWKVWMVECRKVAEAP